MLPRIALCKSDEYPLLHPEIFSDDAEWTLRGNRGIKVYVKIKLIWLHRFAGISVDGGRTERMLSRRRARAVMRIHIPSREAAAIFGFLSTAPRY